jgi:hypothetical protein
MGRRLRADVDLAEATWEQVASLVLARPWTGRCERCDLAQPTDPHHRVLRGQGGLDVPSNLAALCRGCHDWCHANPLDAAEDGWIVPAPHDWRPVPIRLRTAAGDIEARLTDGYGYDVIGWAS